MKGDKPKVWYEAWRSHRHPCRLMYMGPPRTLVREIIFLLKRIDEVAAGNSPFKREFAGHLVAQVLPLLRQPGAYYLRKRLST